jgi:hypothetical protein
VESLGRRLAGRPDADVVLHRACELDGRLQATFRRAVQPTIPPEERCQAYDELAALRRQFDDLLAHAFGSERRGPPSGSALAQLDVTTRQMLAGLLGVPYALEFFPLLEVKAAEYIEQGRAFDELAASFGFEEAWALGANEPRGALILTYSGSLLQLSAPGMDGSLANRRFVYQNIYGTKLPSEGALRLLDNVLVDHRLRAAHMTTSQVRKLRLAVHRGPWERDRATFQQMRQTLQSARSTVWGIAAGWHPSVHVKSIDVVRHSRAVGQNDKASAEARAELRNLLLRLADPMEPAKNPLLEAELIGVLLHLQRLQIESGFPHYGLTDIAAFETDRAERCAVGRRGSILLSRPGKAFVEYPKATIGDQRIVSGAPIALLDASASIAAVLGDVTLVTRS